MNTSPIGAELRALRLAQSIGLREMARAIDVTPSYLSKVERDIEKPSRDLIARIGHQLGLGGEARELLIIRAGHVPADIMEMIQADPTLCTLIRRAYVQFVAMSASRESDGKSWPTSPRA